MASSKHPATDECVVHVQPPLASQLTGKNAHPKDCTTTLYDEDGKLLDDGIDVDDNDTSYWEWFVDKKQARELKRRLAIVESPDYIPGSEVFISMEELDGQETYDEEE